MSKGSFRNPARLVIDVQKAIDDPKWARRGALLLTPSRSSRVAGFVRKP